VVARRSLGVPIFVFEFAALIAVAGVPTGMLSLDKNSLGPIATAFK
jgi:hypothetical protein